MTSRMITHSACFADPGRDSSHGKYEVVEFVNSHGRGSHVANRWEWRDFKVAKFARIVKDNLWLPSCLRCCRHDIGTKDLNGSTIGGFRHGKSGPFAHCAADPCSQRNRTILHGGPRLEGCLSCAAQHGFSALPGMPGSD